MIVYGNITTKVEINPIDVLESLHGDSWYTEDNGKYYRNWDMGAYEDNEEITKEDYDYYKALETIITYLKKNNKHGN